MLVHADPVKAELLGVEELVDVAVVMRSSPSSGSKAVRAGDPRRAVVVSGRSGYGMRWKLNSRMAHLGVRARLLGLGSSYGAAPSRAKGARRREASQVRSKVVFAVASEVFPVALMG